MIINVKGVFSNKVRFLIILEVFYLCTILGRHVHNLILFLLQYLDSYFLTVDFITTLFTWSPQVVRL